MENGKEKVYWTWELGKIEWPFKNWTVHQLRKTCEYNKGISHACVDAFSNYTKRIRKADLVTHMEKQMNDLLQTILNFDEINSHPRKWDWDGYKFRYDVDSDVYQIIAVKKMIKCPKCGHPTSLHSFRCGFCLEIIKDVK